MDDTTVSKTSVYQQDDLQPTSKQEEQLGRMDRHIETLQKEHPEWDLKASSRWWATSIALGADLQKTLDQDTQDKVNHCFARIFEQNFAPPAVEEAHTEMKSILTGHPDILRQMEASFFEREGALAEIYQYTTLNAVAGKALGSCAAMPR
ncbi:hypothetical protein P168DRAFT_322752 [Aspergillus campestris IBT 28561]|uniref:Uncharacterized protein n=1 Tax=Aspergillus campestris (strain IBT 28561) TaxID=1392248 RepID=A0A2I1CQU5_ASPC2|nr:uncharacterized protein P168DRAFT_322752 [Aspergillus campestris IBT 28561]PKX99994.1 hypothetical protein P168DRAFT_322752 [Aspergillus campestris IBT 28561]